MRRATGRLSASGAALAAAATLAALALGGCGDDDGDTTTDAGTLERVRGLPYREPEELTAEDGVLEATIDVAREAVDIDGNQVVTNAYNAQYPGPTLRLSPGDRLELDLVNDTDQHTNVHFHGFHVSPSGNSDNIFLDIHPGTTQHYSVQLPEDHPVGTYWYHSHVHNGTSEEQVFGGMAGIIIIDGLGDLLPEELQGIEDQVVAISDARVRDGELPTSDTQLNPRFFGQVLVNGLKNPAMSIQPGEVQHWRLANISATSWFRVGVKGMPFNVIAEDGNPVEDVHSESVLLIPPGKRYDVLVVGPKAGTSNLRMLKFDQGFVHFEPKTLATITSEGDEVETPALPATVGEFDDLNDAEIATRRTVTFQIPLKDGRPQFLIDGQKFRADLVNIKPKLDTVEEWTIRNTSDEFHPFHIHVNDFQVMSINGEPYDADGFQDVVALPPTSEVVMRQSYTDFTGKTVFHCHILDHEDAGMMQAIRIVE